MNTLIVVKDVCPKFPNHYAVFVNGEWSQSVEKTDLDEAGNCNTLETVVDALSTIAAAPGSNITFVREW